MITGLVVLKMVLTPSRHRLASFANSGPRWSMIGVSIARSTRSGRDVGPGICKKWRPTGREEFLVISLPRALDRESPRQRSGMPQLAAINGECHGQSSLLADHSCESLFADGES